MSSEMVTGSSLLPVESCGGGDGRWFLKKGEEVHLQSARLWRLVLSVSTLVEKSLYL